MIKFSLKTNTQLKFPMSAKEKADISLEIEHVFNQHQELTYMEILVQWAEDNDLDLSEVPQCINDVLRQKIQTEATNLNMMKVDKNKTFSLDFLM